MKSEINAMQTEDSVFHPFMNATRCGAKTRKGTACQSRPVLNRLRCRMHGGTNNGAPKGNCNALKKGFTTREAKQLRKAVREFLKTDVGS